MVKRSIIIALTVVVLVLAACVPQQSGPRPLAQPQTWTVNLTQLGLRRVTLSSNTGTITVSRDGYFQNLRQSSNCLILYHRALHPRPLDTQAKREQFSGAILHCELYGPGTNNYLIALHPNEPEDLYRLWLSEYDKRCGASLYRLGWRYDPPTDTDLSCAPTLAEALSLL